MRTANMRAPRTVMTAGALAIAVPASAVALTAGQAEALSELVITRAPHHLGYGHELTVTGFAPRAAVGSRLALEVSTRGGPWRTLSHTRVHSNGGFRLRAPLTRSGLVRVVPMTPSLTAPGSISPSAPAPGSAPTQLSAAAPATTPTAEASLLASSPAVLAASAPQPVAVAAKLATPTSPIALLGGEQLKLRGTLLPRRAGAVVRLQARARGRWRTVAVARTRPGGIFILRHVERASRQQTIRVSFRGDAGNAGVNSRPRVLVSLQPAVASWYYDGGNTACGFHAGLGVASPYLPCGTTVTFSYHGRTATAVVDDRGPFVAGRQFDLNQNTAAALGFNGVDTVWSSL